MAANFAKLGLTTLASARLAALPAQFATAPEMVELARAMKELPEDRVRAGESRAILEANLAALIARGCAGIEAIDAAGDVTVYRTVDGSWVVDSNGRVAGLLAGRAEVAAAAERLLAGQLPCPSPLMVSGLGTPTLAKELWVRSREYVGGYAPAMHIVEEDARVAAGGLACERLSELIADPRVHWWLGPGARARFAEWCRACPDSMLPTAALPSEGRQGAEDLLTHRALEELRAAQGAELQRLRTEVEREFARRDRAWWKERFAPGAPLCILVLSCRHTTYVRHAAADLAQALESQGHSVRVVEEPDSHTRLTAVSYARALEAHKPDLIVGVNFARQSFSGALPAGVPFVCWIQDAMAHLFDPKQGASQGEWDFVIGHTFAELFEKFGYPAARAMNCAVVASDTKFHDGAIDARTAERFACEVAMVSHHSEPPDRLHARLAKMFGAIQGAAPLIEALAPLVREAAMNAGAAPVTSALRAAISRAAMSTLGRDVDARTATQLLRQYAHPLADRWFRHETLAWAAAICERRGWRMHLYGNGWDQCESLARFARGPADHGEELRAAYQCAGANLHCSITTLVHQRVMECALSGGVCLARMHRDAISGPRTTMRNALIAKAPDTIDEARNAFGYRVVDHPEAMALVSLWQRMGEPHEEEFVWIPRDRAALLKSVSVWLGEDHDANRLFGDLSLLTYSSASSLEALLERCVNEPAWRAGASRMVAGNVRRLFTHRVVAAKAIELVRRSVLA